jgi:hypothetical protein
LCIGVAGIAALEPVGPMPSHVAAFASARTGPELILPAPLVPVDEGALPTRFRWRAGSCAGPFTVVLLDAACAELARASSGDATELVVEGTFAGCLQTPGTYHWYVLACGFGRPVASPVQSFAIP